MAPRRVFAAVVIFVSLEIVFCTFSRAQTIGSSDLRQTNGFLDVSFEKGHTFLDDIQINEIRLKNKKDIRITSMESAGSLPLHIAILIDTSNSQKMIPILIPDFYAQIISSLHLRPIDSACLISFNENADTLQGLTSNLALLLTKLVDLRYGSSTRLFDAIYSSSQALGNKENCLKVMIIITDGSDEASIHTDKQAYDEAIRNNVRVYMFLPADYDNLLQFGNRIQDSVLLHKKYVTRTGGKLFQSYKKDSQSRVVQIMDELSHLKRIRFYIEPPTKNELNLDISVSRKGVKANQGAVVH
jgi:hypothetical protein